VLAADRAWSEHLERRTDGSRITIHDSPPERLLLVDGAVQSVSVAEGATPRGYWSAMLPLRAPQSALILGLGAGTLAHLLRRAYPRIEMTGVEHDREVLAAARDQFQLDAARIEVVEADAFAFLRRCRRQYDLVLVDLFDGEDLPEFSASPAFQRRLRRVVRPGGAVVWNLHRDPRSRSVRHRARRSLLLERTTLTGLNLVLHLRRRARRLR
jgi:spermidine synthase